MSSYSSAVNAVCAHFAFFKILTYGARCTDRVFTLSNNNAIFDSTWANEADVGKCVLIIILIKIAFKVTLKILPCSWWYCAVDVFCTYCVFTLSNCFLVKIHFYINNFSKIILPTDTKTKKQKNRPKHHSATCCIF